jgi:hypothetical protein
MKLSILLVITSLLTGCLGPELITISGFKVTAGTVITVPAKIEAYEKYKKEKKEYKAEEHKKRFEVNKINETTFEIYY